MMKCQFYFKGSVLVYQKDFLKSTTAEDDMTAEGKILKVKDNIRTHVMKIMLILAVHNQIHKLKVFKFLRKTCVII